MSGQQILNLIFMVLDLYSDGYDWHEIVSLLAYLFPKMPEKHSRKVLIGPAWKGWNSRAFVKIRVIHGPKDRVTPFDFKVQTFRVHVQLPTYYHDLTQKNFVRPKRLLSDIFTIFFSKVKPQYGYQTASFDIFKNSDTFEKMSESNLLAPKKFN